MASKRRSAEATARLLIIMSQLMSEESIPQREISRFRFSSVSLRRAGRRYYLTERFLSDLSEELAQLGWIFLRISSDQNALLRADKASSWIQISTKRLNLECGDLPNGSIGTAFHDFLDDARRPEQTIGQMSDEDIIDVFDEVGEPLEDEDVDE